jgi:2'-5' RNA ligase
MMVDRLSDRTVPMPATTRTFIAIALPHDQAVALDRLCQGIAPETPGWRWVPPGHFHITLSFLGDVADTDLDNLNRAITAAAAQIEPFELEPAGLGAFPDPRRPRTLWAGIRGPGLDARGRLQEAVVEAANRAGHPPEDQRFHPHITLARSKASRGGLGPLIDGHQGWSAGLFLVREVIVFASRLGPQGPSYSPLARAPLDGRNTESAP